MDADVARLAEPDMVSLIRRSLAQREGVRGVALSTYRVELTAALERLSRNAERPGDRASVGRLATKISEAAAIEPRMGVVEREADALGARVEAAERGGEPEESAMLLVGLRLVDRILESVSSPTSSFTS
jgi:hypothetical protein